jgi:enoyl-CoA hydratase
MTTEPHLLTERRGHVLIVTLNRPEARNSLSSEMLVGAHNAWHLLDEDDDLRVGILTGAGGNFCSGMDLKAFGSIDMSTVDRGGQKEGGEIDGLELAWHALLRHFRPSKPIISAVEGYCVAGGSEILQATELRVAGESAQFAIAEVRRGLFPLGGSTVRLQHQIPFTMAADLLLTGRMISAAEAKDIGLIGHVVPDGQALTKAREIAEVIAGNGPLAVEAIIKTLHETIGMTEPEAFAYEQDYGQAVFRSEDAKEGPKAFAEKRKPNFQKR